MEAFHCTLNNNEHIEEKLVKAITDSFDISEEKLRDCIRAALEDFVGEQTNSVEKATKPVAKTSTKTSTKTPSAKAKAGSPKGKSNSPKSSSSQNQTCEGVMKKGGVCGKKAANKVDDKWYCGVHRPDKSKVVATKSSNTKTTKSTTKSTKEKSKGEKTLHTKKGTLKENKEATQQRLSTLIKKKVKPEEIKIQKINGRNMDIKTRILFDEGCAYGKLADNDVDILHLEDEDIAILDLWGVEVKTSIPLNLQNDENSDEDTEEDPVLMNAGRPSEQEPSEENEETSQPDEEHDQVDKTNHSDDVSSETVENEQGDSSDQPPKEDEDEVENGDEEEVVF
jgi:hypothetical protein